MRMPALVTCDKPRREDVCEGGVTVTHPNGRAPTVRPADVGYMSDGAFITLFNARESSLPSSSQGTPSSRPYPQEKVSSRTLNTVWFSSGSVDTLVTPVNNDTECVEMKATLACRMKDGGVALILPGHDESIKVYREDLLYGEDLQKYCFDQRDDCLQQLAAAAGPEVGMDDLIFVTGVYNVRAWALFSFMKQSNECVFRLKADPFVGSGCQIDVRSPSSSKIGYSPTTNFGPPNREKPGVPDQTVVLRQLKLRGRDESQNGSKNESKIRKNTSGKRKRSRTDEQSDDDDGSDGRDDRKSGGPGPGGRGRGGSGSGSGSGGGGGGDSGTTGRLRWWDGGIYHASGSGDPGEGSSGRSTHNYQSTHRNGTVRASGDVVGVMVVDSPDCSTLSSAGDSSSESEECEPLLEPLDALLEYILDACPDAQYSCAGDDDLVPFLEHLQNWTSFPGILRTIKPNVHLHPDGLASLLRVECPPVLLEVTKPSSRTEEESIHEHSAGVSTSMVTTGVLTLPNDNTDTGEFTSNSPLTPSRPTIPADSHCMQSYTRTPVLHTDETITSARSVRPEHWIKFRRRNPRPCGRCKKQKVRCEVTAPYSPELCGNCKTHGLTTCHTSQPDTGGRQLQRRRRRRNVYPSSSTALDDTNGGMTSESRHLPVARSSFAPWSPLPQSSSGLQSLAETQHSHPSSTGWMAANPIFSTHETDIQPTDIENLFPSERPYPYVSTLRAAPNPIFSAIQTEIPPRAIRNPQFLSETSHTSHASSTGGMARSPMDYAFQTEFQPTTSGFGDVSRRPYVGQHTSASLRATSPLMQPFYFPWPYRTGSPDPTRGIAPSEPTPSPIHMASESAGPSQPRLTPKDAPDS